ncbi:MAG: hypothetical protein GX421_02490 [Caldisericales bacterium]|nr:hypothetical protein [Caldisericales bacterium]
MQQLTSLLLGFVVGLFGVSGPGQTGRNFGAIEGYYGKPLSLERRTSLVRTMGSIGLNFFMVAPKNEPHLAKKWRDDLPETLRAEMSQLAVICKENGIELCLSISPGSRFHKGEIALLVKRVYQLSSYNPNCFALLFDDIGVLRSGNLGKLHAEASNAVLSSIRKRNPFARLLVCPTQYFGSRKSEYLCNFLVNLDRSITIFWTGPDVVPEEIGNQSFADFRKVAGRDVVVWDNYPVNDFNPKCLWLGEYYGRHIGVARKSFGLLLNISERSEISKISLARFADFLGASPCGSMLAYVMGDLFPLHKEAANSLLKIFDVRPGRKTFSWSGVAASFSDDGEFLLKDLLAIATLSQVGNRMLEEDLYPWTESAKILSDAISTKKITPNLLDWFPTLKNK